MRGRVWVQKECVDTVFKRPICIFLAKYPYGWWLGQGHPTSNGLLCGMQWITQHCINSYGVELLYEQEHEVLWSTASGKFHVSRKVTCLSSHSHIILKFLTHFGTLSNGFCTLGIISLWTRLGAVYWVILLLFHIILPRLTLLLNERWHFGKAGLLPSGGFYSSTWAFNHCANDREGWGLRCVWHTGLFILSFHIYCRRREKNAQHGHRISGQSIFLFFQVTKMDICHRQLVTCVWGDFISPPAVCYRQWRRGEWLAGIQVIRRLLLYKASESPFKGPLSKSPLAEANVPY